MATDFHSRYKNAQATEATPWSPDFSISWNTLHPYPPISETLSIFKCLAQIPSLHKTSLMAPVKSHLALNFWVLYYSHDTYHRLPCLGVTCIVYFPKHLITFLEGFGSEHYSSPLYPRVHFSRFQLLIINHSPKI